MAGAGGTVTEPELFTVNHQLASDVEPSAPGTIGIVTWSVDLPAVVEARIEFGLDTTYGMAAPVDLAATDYRTLLLGMKPSKSYHFRITANDGSLNYLSDDFTIDTGPPTDLIDLDTFNVLDEGAREPGFIVASFWQGQANSIPFILDADGEVVWWYESGVNGIARARMSADGKNMWLVMANNNGGAVQRVSMDTLEGQSYNQTTASHDITPVSGETMAFLDYGESDCDSIFEIDPSGTANEVFESEGVVQSMGCHANALRYSETEDVYTLSDLNQDVLVINRAGSVEWRLSEITTGGNSAWGGAQHGHHLLADSLLILANRGGDGNASAAVEYSLAGQEIFRYESGDSTQNLGDVQRLPGGNTLVTFSNDGIIHQVDADANLVLEVDSGGQAFGYAVWRESLYGPPPDTGL